jgi:hypothetical protein
MTKFVSTLAIVVLGLAALAAIGPTLVRLINALVPLVLVVGILAVVWQVTKYLTRQ